MQIQFGMTPPKTLIQFVKNRWNSVLLMLKRLLELKDVIDLLLIREKKWDNLMKPNWDLAEKLVKLLQPLLEITVEMSYDRKTTVSKVIPITYGLLKLYESMEVEDGCIQNIHNQLLKSIKDRLLIFEDRQTTAIATLLDPRYKNKLFYGGATKIEAAKAMLKEVARKYYEDSISTNTTAREHNENVQNSENGSTVMNLIDQALKNSQGSNTHNPFKEFDDELEAYLASETIDTSIEPLRWWDTIGKSQYPKLYRYVP